MNRYDVTGRFKVQNIPYHTHNGVDSPAVHEDNLIQSVSVSGNISFASSDTYTIYLNSSFTPSSILVYGNITGASTERYMSIGSANLVPSFYLQPSTNRSVITGNVQYPFVDPNLGVTVPLQSSCYFGAEAAATGNNIHTLSSEGHVVNVFYGGSTLARATITAFSRGSIQIVTTIVAGWEINANFVIT